MTAFTHPLNGDESVEERIVRIEEAVSRYRQSPDWWKMFSSVVAAVSIIVSGIMGVGNWALAQQLRPLYLKLEQQEKSLSAVADEIGKMKDRIADIREKVASINKQ